MPLQTKDYQKVDTRTWRCDLYRYQHDISDSVQIKGTEVASKTAAERWVRTNLPRYDEATNPETGSVHATIQEGVYEDASFDDGTYGRVLDVDWNYERQPFAYCQIVNDKVDIGWEDLS